MKKTILVGAVALALSVFAEELPSWDTIRTNIDARETALSGLEVTSAKAAAASAIVRSPDNPEATVLSTACDTFTIWLLASAGIAVDSDLRDGFIFLVQ